MNETQSFVDDFRDLLVSFVDEGVVFVLIGGGPWRFMVTDAERTT
jgi:hypothetical protein